jgi:hypothetical protein
LGELEDLHAQLERLGLHGHVHGGDPNADTCPIDEICISEEMAFSALLRAPGRSQEVHVDSMTAFNVLEEIPDNAGFETAWAGLVEIDRGS